jgi:hypothetical protein
MARDLSLDVTAMKRCVAEPTTREWAIEQALAARKEKILTVPAHRKDGKKLTPEEFDSFLD